MGNYLNEAFKSLNLLESDFNITADRGVDDSKLTSFTPDDVEEVPVEEIDVIDRDATNPDELADNYVGKIIIKCSCCGAKFFADLEGLKYDKESGLVNMDVRCDKCNNSFGYNVIGKDQGEVEDDKITSSDVYEKSEEDIEDDGAFPDDDVKDESLRSSFFSRVNEGWDDSVDGIRKFLVDDEDEALDGYDKAEKALNKLGKKSDVFKDIKADEKDHIRKVNKRLRDKTDDDLKEARLKAKKRFAGKDIKEARLSNQEMADALAKKLGLDNNVEEACEGGVCDESCGKKSPYRGKKKIKEARLSNKEMADALRAALNLGGEEEAEEDFKYHHKGKRFNEAEEKFPNPDKHELETTYKKVKIYHCNDCGKYAAIVNGKKVKKNSVDEIKKLIDAKNEAIDFKATNEDNVKVNKYDDGTMAINVGNPDPGIEEIGELDDGDLDKIIATGDEEDHEMTDEFTAEPTAEEEPVGGEEEGEEAEEEPEADIDEFEEEDFDKMGESFMRKTYSNVAGYKTTNVIDKGNSFIIEGVITSKSGKIAKTSFEFTEAYFTKRGKLMLEGINKTFSDKPAFRVKCSFKNGVALPEAMYYRYVTKSINESTGKRDTVRGLIKIKK